MPESQPKTPEPISSGDKILAAIPGVLIALAGGKLTYDQWNGAVQVVQGCASQVPPATIAECNGLPPYLAYTGGAFILTIVSVIVFPAAVIYARTGRDLLRELIEKFDTGPKE